METSSNLEDDEIFVDALDYLPSPEYFISGEETSPPPPTTTGSLRRRRSSIGRRIKKGFKTDSSDSTITQESQPSISDPPPSPLPRQQSYVEQQQQQSAGLLVSTASLIIKAVIFQLKFCFTCLTMPFLFLCFTFSLATNPYGTVKPIVFRFKDWIFWIPKFVLNKFIAPYVSDCFRGQDGYGKLALRVLWGCFWSVYVGIVLVGLLVWAFLGGRIVVKSVIEEPLRVSQELSFDYTKPNPDAVVPLAPQITDCSGKLGAGKAGIWQVVPRGHRLQLIVSLTLPESDYNWKLGVFQVRAEFLTASGKVVSTASHPCMLRYKSPHVRLVETLLKTGTLLVGYSSETQLIKLKMTGSLEGLENTACIKVILEQRAEYKPDAGIPEIYTASVKIESKHPFFKRILWNWRRTLFMWISMWFYILEISVILVCCRPLIIPRFTLFGTPNRA